MLKLSVLVSLLFLISCAKKDEQVIDSAKQEAKWYLTNSKCSDAKKALDDAGFQMMMQSMFLFMLPYMHVVLVILN